MILTMEKEIEFQVDFSRYHNGQDIFITTNSHLSHNPMT
jgi:hypothetical protein